MDENELKKYFKTGVDDYLKTRKRSMHEFSKSMIKLYSYACIAWVTASYVLAALDKQVNEMITCAVITSLATVLIGYFFKSLKENISKNKKDETSI